MEKEFDIGKEIEEIERDVNGLKNLVENANDTIILLNVDYNIEQGIAQEFILKNFQEEFSKKRYTEEEITAVTSTLNKAVGIGQNHYKENFPALIEIMKDGFYGSSDEIKVNITFNNAMTDRYSRFIKSNPDELGKKVVSKMMMQHPVQGGTYTNALNEINEKYGNIENHKAAYSSLLQAYVDSDKFEDKSDNEKIPQVFEKAYQMFSAMTKQSNQAVQPELGKAVFEQLMYVPNLDSIGNSMNDVIMKIDLETVTKDLGPNYAGLRLPDNI